MNRIYWVPALPSGRLGMMARPRGNDWLEDEIRHLKFQQVDTIVSLLERSEVIELGLQKEETLCEDMLIEYASFPIPDRGTPDNQRGFISLVKSLRGQLSKGKQIVIHCRMGIGRTSLLCAAILVSLGHDSLNIFEELSHIRTMKVPDTEEQRSWLINISDKLHF